MKGEREGERTRGGKRFTVMRLAKSGGALRGTVLSFCDMGRAFSISVDKRERTTTTLFVSVAYISYAENYMCVCFVLYGKVHRRCV